jgi:hypothetical protein
VAGGQAENLSRAGVITACSRIRRSVNLGLHNKDKNQNRNMS